MTARMNNQTITTIAVDAMGGDIGPNVTVNAGVDFLLNNPSHQIILVGLLEQMQAEVDKRKEAQACLSDGRLVLHEATEVVGMDEAPAMALKKKKDSSMRVAINLVKQGQAQACVSAGNTGALMATARFVLKMLPGIERPAICTAMPSKTPDKAIHMLDLGANVDSTPEMLLQFAYMGSILTECVYAKNAPKIGLLNVGSEDIKGNDKVKKTALLLNQSSLNYTGFIEGDQIYSNKVDVVVCDGFEGNISLKTSEGVAKLLFDILKEEFSRNIFTKLVALLSLPVFKGIKKRLDPANYNGASLLGLNGIVIKSHGGASRKAFLRAIDEAKLQAERNVITQIADRIAQTL